MTTGGNSETMRNKLAQQFGLARSLLIYYAPGRVRRLRRFYAALIGPGDLCFDIGAHVGNRIAAWTGLGARVVAVEPQAHLMAWLRRRYGDKPAVTLVEAAVGAAEGAATLRLDPRNPTVASLSPDWIAAVSGDASFSGVQWRTAAPVRLTTLDALIAAHGRPALCKIDVEGFEAEALRGLSQPLPLVSFEYIPAAMTVAYDCLGSLAALGEYEFNWFSGESHRWASPDWLNLSQMTARLDALAAGRASGDIFARKK
jgi:FkbM family methyltransferase